MITTVLPAWLEWLWPHPRIDCAIDIRNYTTQICRSCNYLSRRGALTRTSGVRVRYSPTTPPRQFWFTSEKDDCAKIPISKCRHRFIRCHKGIMKQNIYEFTKECITNSTTQRFIVVFIWIVYSVSLVECPQSHIMPFKYLCDPLRQHYFFIFLVYVHFRLRTGRFFV